MNAQMGSTRTRRSLFRKAGVMLALTMLLSACGGAKTDAPSTAGAAQPADSSKPKGSFDEAKFADLIKAAKEEGELLIYGTASPEGTENIGQVFTKKFGIQVNYWRATGPQVVERFQSEARAGKGPDVIFTSPFPVLSDLKNKGLLMEYRPATADMFPADAKIDGYSYPHHVGTIVLTVNTDKVTSDELQTLVKDGWKGLLQPSLSEKIAITDPYGAAVQDMLYYMFLEAKKDEYGEDYLKKLAEQKPIIKKLVSLSGESAATGEVAVGMGFDTVQVNSYIKGAKIQILYPTPAVYVPLTFSISKTAPHPNAAKLWQEWNLSVEGEKNASDVFLARPAMPGIADTRPFAKEPWFKAPTPDQMFTVTDAEAFKKVVKSVEQRWSEIFNYKP